MTDDPLRAACEQWLDDHIGMADDYGYVPPVDALLRFAKQQQAEGVRRAKDEAQNRAMKTGKLEREMYRRDNPESADILSSERMAEQSLADWCEATAKALEEK